MLICFVAAVLFAVIPIVLIGGAEMLIYIVYAILIAVIPIDLVIIINIDLMIIIYAVMMLLIAAVKVILIAAIPIDLAIIINIDLMIIIYAVMILLIAAGKAVLIAVIPIGLTVIILPMTVVFVATAVGQTPPLAFAQLLADPDRLVVFHVRRSLIREEAALRLPLGQFPVDEGVLRVLGYRSYVGVVVALRDVGAQRIGRRVGFLRRRLGALVRAQRLPQDPIQRSVVSS